jgi:hypothetical protein
MYADASSLGVFSGGTSGHFTAVQFDVSVIAEMKAGGKGGLRVWSVGVEGSGEHTFQHSSRVKSAVHVKLPDASRCQWMLLLSIEISTGIRKTNDSPGSGFRSRIS